MFKKVLIANRGEIVGRVARTLKRMGIASVAVASEADRFNRAVLDADEHVLIGPAPAAESYLLVERILDACRSTGAEAVHPGYGFLSENVGFARALAAEGIAFIGPRPEHLEAFGLKHTARALAKASGVPLLPGSGLLDDVAAALAAAESVGYPVMLKSTAGGGGIGMQLCFDAAELLEKFPTVQRMAQQSFGDARVYLERFVATARHIEVQIFGNGKGGVMALGERDCSLQRRHQKVVEETPAPGISDELRAALAGAAIALGKSVSYESAGTVEFVYDVSRGDFSFLEVNTRLQVEHPVTEAVTGIDLVEWMIRQAAGEDMLAGRAPVVPEGAAIEVRLYAESALQGFRPSAGRLTEVRFPEMPGVRVDGWIEAGSDVTPFYDPMLAKIIATGPDRPAALATLQAALAATTISGIETNLGYLRAIADTQMFAAGEVATSVLGAFPYQPAAAEVILPGAQSSLQELPGRLGLWHVGVPPSGPMDARSFRLANRIVGNHEEATALEMTVSGPTLTFHTDAVIALAGAEMTARIGDRIAPYGEPVAIAAGETLTIGAIVGPGQRTYLAVRGAFDAPDILGSRATFALGGFGGHATGTLTPGDILAFGSTPPVAGAAPQPLARLTHDWQIAVVYGPHGAPDFFTDGDIDTLFAASYEVHFNSARTGVRLTGPKPDWARADGGEAGLHPSNLHDNAYAIGAIDFTGDTPIILGPDGPSLGGFVCPAVVAAEDLWKIGQLKPGDRLRFHPVARPADPVAGPTIINREDIGSPILARGDDVVYRRQGDANLLVEFGTMSLDIGLRLKAHGLMQALEALRLPGVVDLTPGIRSLQVHYDPDALSRTKLLGVLAEIEQSLPSVEDVVVPSRIVHLPLSWNDPTIQLAARKYQELVRPNAPWCPDNIEFIRRINGLVDETEVQKTIFDASYLVMGLGDVYLGAPVATPLDPRHRLVTTKYNPARTWTPENAVGIGGAYMCIYGMEGPGGYQLFGRTVQMWNAWRRTRDFENPWLLRFFDQIRFYPVDGAELAEARAAFPHGAYPIRIEETEFRYADHLAMLAANEPTIRSAKIRQQTAFDSERQHWKDSGIDDFVELVDMADANAGDLPPGCTAVTTHVPGSVWKLAVENGAFVEIGETIAILESMKMEISIPALARGRLREYRTKPGRQLRAGDILAILETLP